MHYSARPERLIELVGGNPEKELFVIDEIQKVPELLDVVHQVMESKRNVRFVLTGSSARKLKQSGVEVDFVIYGESTLVSIEVKNSKNIRSADLKGLRAFKTDYPEADCLFLYRGTEKLMKNEILCMPINMFLKGLKPGNAILGTP